MPSMLHFPTPVVFVVDNDVSVGESGESVAMLIGKHVFEASRDSLLTTSAT